MVLTLLLVALLTPSAYRVYIPMAAQPAEFGWLEARYASSIDPEIDNLYIACFWPARGRDLPVVMALHGFGDGAEDMSIAAVLPRMARQGVVACAPGMRGRDKAKGTPDAGGRELHDVIDGLAYARAHAPASPTHAAAVGYSGGGGNALALAMRYPETFGAVVSHFGMSDYAAWYAEAPDFRPTLAAWAGGTPAEVPERYAARSSVEGIANFGGRVYLYHDSEDGLPLGHSLRVAERAKNVTLRISRPGDPIRWLHRYPIFDGQGPQASEDEWLTAVAARRHPPQPIPQSGTLHVGGYLETPRLSVWFGDGQSGAGAVRYDLAAGRVEAPAGATVRHQSAT